MNKYNILFDTELFKRLFNSPVNGFVEVFTSYRLYFCGRIIANLNKSKKLDGIIQKPKLFNLGNATSFEPTWYGIKKFAKNPKNNGITTKKIIINACKVIICK